MFIDDITTLRPITYISFAVASHDGSQHSVQLYFDNTAEFCVNTVTSARVQPYCLLIRFQVNEEVVWKRYMYQKNLVAMRIGTQAQKVFGVAGDAVGIDWGYLYSATPAVPGLTTVMFGALEARNR